MRALLLAAALLAGGCGGKEPPPPYVAPPLPPEEPLRPERTAPEGQPKRILIERIVIAFTESSGDLKSPRPKQEAERLAKSLVQRIRGGADVIVLRDEFSDDRLRGEATANGPYIFCNYGVPHRNRPDGVAELPRDNLFPDVGDLAFSLGVGEVGLAEFHPKRCPHGYDILYRVR